MEQISYIVVNGTRYPVENGTTVNIDGVLYSIDDLIGLAQNNASQEETPQEQEPVAEETSSGSVYQDVSYIVLNGDKYSIDDIQATTDLQKLQASIANQYNPLSTYNVGDYCLHDSTLYVCTSQIETPEEWDESHWQAILVTDVTGVSDYNELQNKPSINDVPLQDNVTLQQLGLQGIYYNTKAGWNSQPSLIAEEGAIYIYKDYSTISDGNTTKNVPALKIGDGTSYLIDMPIVNGDIADILSEHISNVVIHVTSDDKTFWNNKSSAYIQPNETETLVLSNTSFMLEGVIHNHV